MRTDWTHLERYRVQVAHRPSFTGDHFGVFFIHVGKDTLRVIASEGMDELPWEHVSVTVECYRTTRLATWPEMCRVKDLFWEAEEECVQIHPKQSEYVNEHPHCLHIWRPKLFSFEMPPRIML